MCGCHNIPCDCSASELTYETPEAVAGATITIPGHPIWMIDEASDIALFDGTSGEGSGIWANWALCDGQSHTSSTGATIGTPDLRNQFVVGALDTYAVGDTGGAATHTLLASEMPTHTHVITDPGHIHTATQPAHTHTLTDPGHSHGTSDPGHTHAITIGNAGSHDHTIDIEYGIFGELDDNPTEETFGPAAGTADTLTTSVEPDHTHTGSAASQTTGITVSTATTGITASNTTPAITVASNTTGISAENAGSGSAHNNLPPYYALVYIKHIG